MIAFASLADKKLADEICKEISKQGILYRIDYDPSTNQYILLVDKEENIGVALDIYRVMLGLPRQFEQSEEWSKIQSVSMGPVTMVVVAFCIGIFILGDYKIVPELYTLMQLSPDFFTDFNIMNVWKLVTPVFIHFGIIHILFNMMWMKDLGKVVEAQRGGNFLIFFIFLVGAFSNAAQFFSIGPNFGGMSGVIYGLLGYLWMNKRFNKNSEYSLAKQDIYIMVGWFFLCLSGALSFSIANMAHAMGLSLGMLVGIFFGMSESKEEKQWTAVAGYFVFALALPIFTQFIELFKLSMKSGA
ncbi:rhomboid family intramembrane serine protease [Halobacteriovorax sp. HLS]|uniref:rhomboid family intramembrane serine protease n=1 Tax=Halobacteriovorax sp. HLS TaxID=2234000 RepID=UPI000FD87132|nr:rhomboid family intramembrane serine protease [Halobacteriovorax sp. HLS]